MRRGRESGWIRGGRRSLRRFGCALALAAILSQTLVLLLHRPAGAAAIGATSREAPASVGEHDHRLHTAPPAADREKQKPAPKPPHCPICLALHVLGGFVPPGATALRDDSPPTGSTFGPPPASRWTVGIFAGGAQPRAPPLLS